LILPQNKRDCNRKMKKFRTFRPKAQPREKCGLFLERDSFFRQDVLY
jgi:hypothetical protein